jgi:hypothetical protein
MKIRNTLHSPVRVYKDSHDQDEITSFQKYVVYDIFCKLVIPKSEMSSFPKVKPLPGGKKQFPNVTSRVKSISDRKVSASKSIPMNSTPDFRKVDDSTGIFRFGYVPTAVSGTSLQQKRLVPSSLPLGFKSKIPVRTIFVNASTSVPEVKLDQKKAVSVSAKVVKAESRTQGEVLRKPFRASPVPSSTYKAPRQFLRSQLPVTKNVVTKTLEELKPKLIISTPATSPRTIQLPIRPVDESIAACTIDDQKPEPVETEQLIVEHVTSSETQDATAHFTSLILIEQPEKNLNTDKDVMITNYPSSASSEVSSPEPNGVDLVVTSTQIHSVDTGCITALESSPDSPDTVEDVMITDCPSSVSSQVSPLQSTDELEKDEHAPMIELDPLGVPDVEPNSVDLASPNQKNDVDTGCVAELEPTSPESPAVLLPVFSSCDYRYIGKSHVPGYTVIPNQPASSAQLEDRRQRTPDLDSFVVDTPRPVTPTKSVEFEHPFDNFRIQDAVVKTEGCYMDVLSNIPAVHFGRILGRNLQNVTMLRERFGVKISVVRQMNPEDGLQVFINSGLPADRHEVADYIVEEVIPVQVEVYFGFGFLTKSKKTMARQRYPFVVIEKIDDQGHCILRGRLADCRNLFVDLKCGRY